MLKNPMVMEALVGLVVMTRGLWTFGMRSCKGTFKVCDGVDISSWQAKEDSAACRHAFAGVEMRLLGVNQRNIQDHVNWNIP